MRVGAVVLIVATVAGCGGTESYHYMRPTLAATRGTILISIDTLRADHLGCYGYHRDTSPFLDSLARRGVLFENAFVQLPGTLPSHMSIFTGLYPAEHNVYPPAGVLSPEIETLPEAFQRAGFRTAGHTEGGYVHGGYGFARGFDEFSHEAWKIETDVERTVARGLDFLRRLDQGDRFFLFLHTYVVHDPYFPAPEYLSLYWPHPQPEAFLPTGPNLAAFNRGEGSISRRGLEFYRAAYDASITYADDVFRDFFAELSNLGLDDVTVVLTSDHGEEFLDHGKMVHQQTYPETLRVPLIVLHPEIRPRRVATVVRSIDLAPTLYDVAGIEPRNRVSGRSLVPLLAGGEEQAGEAFAENHSRRKRVLVRQSGGAFYMLLQSAPKAGEGAVRVDLYDLAADPGAVEDLSDARRAAVRRLVSGLRSYDDLEPVSTAKALEMDPELEQRLKALGYLQ